MTLFHVGQMVVYIGTDGEWPPQGHKLERGRVYTIREIVARIEFGDDVGLRLEEIANSSFEGVAQLNVRGAFNGVTRRVAGEPVYLSCDFRPCRKTDISALRELVAPKPKVEV